MDDDHDTCHNDLVRLIRDIHLCMCICVYACVSMCLHLNALMLMFRAQFQPVDSPLVDQSRIRRQREC